MCKVCEENEFNEITGVEVIVKHENPKAYGYPEVVNWDKRYKMENCPFCGRLLENVDLETK